MILSEALSQYDYAKINWCNEYVEEIRKIMIQKYYDISKEIFTYIENYTTYTQEELAEEKKKTTMRGKIDENG